MKIWNLLLSGVVLLPLAAFGPGALGGVSIGFADATRCEVTFGVSGSQNLGALNLRVGYGGAPGTFVGAAEAVMCVSLAPGVFASAQDDESLKELRLGAISVIGVPLPQNFWSCSFDTVGVNPIANDFSILVDGSLTTTGGQTPVTATVSSIVCGNEASCGNGVVDGDEQCDDAGMSLACDAGCRLTPVSQRCVVSFAASAAQVLGGLQFYVNYGDARGDFDGEGEGVLCSRTIPSALTAMDDRDLTTQLRLGLISPSGLTLPANLWRCIFTTQGTRLRIEKLVVSDVVAVDVNSAPLVATVTPTIVGCVSAPGCGNGIIDPGEQCDDGELVAGDCCSPTCAFESAATLCRPAVGSCDAAETCTGVSGACPVDLKRTTQCRASTGVCDQAEICNGTSVQCPADQFLPTGTVCTSDGNVCTTDRCDGAGTCGHPANSAPCEDGLFCNGEDTCAAGACSLHAGSPCPGPDGDAICTESCNEAADQCTAPDPNGSSCNDGNPATSNDQCSNGVCAGTGGGSVCGDADGNGTVSATDALRVLNAAVGSPVSCPLSRCDVDGSGTILSSDALKVLRKAVGQPVVLSCKVS